MVWMKIEFESQENSEEMITQGQVQKLVST